MKIKLFILALLLWGCNKENIQPSQVTPSPQKTSVTDTLYTNFAVWQDDTLGWGKDTALHLNPPYYWTNNLNSDTIAKHNSGTIINIVIWIRTNGAWVKLPVANFFTQGDSIMQYKDYVSPSTEINYRYGKIVRIPTNLDIKEAITYK